jgi:hypothetical protein
MARKRTRSKYVQPPTAQIAGVVTNGLSWAWDHDKEMLLLDFMYTPFEETDNYVVARVHVPPSIVTTVKKAAEEFLKARAESTKKQASRKVPIPAANPPSRE